ncbi:MAG: hypothetical protein D6701_00965, partial [Gemmatimonadetes bacterium]
ALELARAAARDFEAERLRAGTLTFQDLLMRAVAMLRASPEARRFLGTRYRRLLIDEFQDTDPVQAEILFLLASAGGESGERRASGGAARAQSGPAAGADGDADGVVEPGAWIDLAPRPGSLFVVGDPKQSIYRFRRADIELYTFVRERFERFGRVLRLDANFRSLRPISGLVADVFDREEAFPREATPYQAPFAPLRVQRSDGHPAEGVYCYDLPDENRTEELVKADAKWIASWIVQRTGEGGDRAPGDFMILTRQRRHLAAYAGALEERGVPVAVSGAALVESEEIDEVRVLLEALAHPDDPVRLTAALVGLFFGLSFQDLASHVRGGGRISLAAGAADEAQPTDVSRALAQIGVWTRWAREQPADVVVQRIVDETGLLATAAARPLGSLRAGGLLYALEAVRRAALDGNTSLAGALEALQAAADATEAEAPLEPLRDDAVAVMNLHRAKGLEAPVVVLAAPVGERTRAVTRHVRRDRDDGDAVGGVVVTERRGWADAVLALPPGWEALEAEERRFEAAEDVRLLYVAVTRARDELVVARPGGKGRSPWGALDEWLEQHGKRLE